MMATERSSLQSVKQRLLIPKPLGNFIPVRNGKKFRKDEQFYDEVI
jgi:hypothetical protein